MEASGPRRIRVPFRKISSSPSFTEGWAFHSSLVNKNNGKKSKKKTTQFRQIHNICIFSLCSLLNETMARLWSISFNMFRNERKYWSGYCCGRRLHPASLSLMEKWFPRVARSHCMNNPEKPSHPTRSFHSKSRGNRESGYLVYLRPAWKRVRSIAAISNQITAELTVMIVAERWGRLCGCVVQVDPAVQINSLLNTTSWLVEH